MLPFPPRVFAKEYLAINPLGTIPFMIDGETKMTESSGICHYLGTRYGPTPLVVGPDEPAYGAFLNWMYFSDATLTFPQTLVLRYSQLEPEERRNPQVAGDYAKWFLGRLRAVEAATGKAETLVRRPVHAADIVNGYALRLADNIGLAKDFGPNVAAYWQRLQARDGYKRAVAAERKAGVEQNVAPRIRGLMSAVIPVVESESRVPGAIVLRDIPDPVMRRTPRCAMVARRSGQRAARGGRAMDDKGQQIRPSDADHPGARVLRGAARPPAQALLAAGSTSMSRSRAGCGSRSPMAARAMANWPPCRRMCRHTIASDHPFGAQHRDRAGERSARRARRPRQAPVGA